MAAPVGAVQPRDAAGQVADRAVRVHGPHHAAGGQAGRRAALGGHLRRQFAGQLTVGSIVWGSSRSGQIGYWIDEAFAGHGIIPTALAMAVDHCFRVMGMHRLEASIRPENAASRRVVEKLGFRDEGVRVRQLHINGTWRDHICYAITAEEVPAGHAAPVAEFARRVARVTVRRVMNVKMDLCF